MTNVDISTLNKKIPFTEKRIVYLGETIVTSYYVLGICFYRSIRLQPEQGLIGLHGIGGS